MASSPGLKGLMSAVDAGGDEEEEAPPDVESGGAESEMLSRAFDASKSGDKASFTSSMLSAIRACVQKELAAGPESEEV